MSGSWWLGFRVLIDPGGAIGAAVARPTPWRVLAVLVCAWTALSLATVPRQVGLLASGFAAGGDPALEAGRQALVSGLTRLIVVDRLVPFPAALLGAVFLVLAAEPVLVLPRDRRPALVAVAVIGLAPVVVGRLGELGYTWLVSTGGDVAPGMALTLPHRFAIGARLFWIAATAPPPWVELLESRLNLVTLWSAALWAAGLAHLDRGRLEPWHGILAFGCLVLAGIVTWVAGPIVVPVVLRGAG